MFTIFQLLLLLQFVDTIREVEPVPRFKSAISKQTTGVLIVGIAWVALLGDYGRGDQDSSRVVVTTILTSLQLAAVLALMATIWFVKRRPAVFRPDGGKIVDREMNDGLWSRYSFQWCAKVLAAGAKEKLENADLPAMNHAIRSEDATNEFNDMILKDTLPLWIQISWHYRGQLILQWLTILLSNFFDVAPAFATLQLLQFLETRENLDTIDPTAWKYVFTIILATASSHMIDSRIMWWGMGYIVVPLRTTLTGLMYRKLLKIKGGSEPPKQEKHDEEVCNFPISNSRAILRVSSGHWSSESH